MIVRCAALVVLWLAFVDSAQAERFAIAIGSNRGNVDEEQLRWAHEDARRTQQLLLELGGVDEGNALLVVGGGVGEVRTAFAELGRRVRAAQQRSGQLLRSGRVRCVLAPLRSRHLVDGESQSGRPKNRQAICR